ncbi:MAG: hypothetical protein REI78_10585 [Pedobacter sp.]|nr:hypothetical protein [Pedobacter sp.]MDQ8053465.1 hypothetical protein [Pedobacter sp.]
MKNTWPTLMVLLLFAACTGSEKPVSTSKKVEDLDTARQVVDTILLTKADTAFLVKNKPIADDMGDRQKDYRIKIYFSTKKWPVLTFKNAIGAELFLVGDLDADGKPELLLRPEWFSSCWASINLFSQKGDTWKCIRTGSMYFCADEYPLGKRIIKTDQGYALLTDSLANDKFITLKKEIRF